MSQPTLSNGRPLLTAVDLHKRLGSTEVLRGVSLEVFPGTLSLLTGGNGAGKTTLLDILTGYVSQDAGVLTVLGHRIKPSVARIFSTSRAARFARWGVVRTWQDSRLFETRTLIDNIAVATPDQLGECPLAAVVRPIAVGREQDRIKRCCVEMLDTFGLVGRGMSSADRVSLGQARRVAILRAVQTGSRVILMDEPLAGLDADGKASVLELIETLRRDRGVAFVVVEHMSNTSAILPLQPRRLTLESGRLVTGTTSGEDAPVSGEWLARALSSGRIEMHDLPRGARLWISGSGERGEPLLEVREIALRRGNREVFNARTGTISFTLHANEVGVLEAPNGWGKTTLCDALAGVVGVAAGKVRINGTDTTHARTHMRVRNGLRYVRATTDQFGSLSVAESLGLSGMWQTSEHWRPFARRRVATLSGGERRRLALACASFGNPVVEIFDEPFSALDTSGVSEYVASFSPRKSRTRLIAMPIQTEDKPCH